MDDRDGCEKETRWRSCWTTDSMLTRGQRTPAFAEQSGALIRGFRGRHVRYSGRPRTPVAGRFGYGSSTQGTHPQGFVAAMFLVMAWVASSMGIVYLADALADALAGEIDHATLRVTTLALCKALCTRLAWTAIRDDRAHSPRSILVLVAFLSLAFFLSPPAQTTIPPPTTPPFNPSAHDPLAPWLPSPSPPLLHPPTSSSPSFPLGDPMLYECPLADSILARCKTHMFLEEDAHGGPARLVFRTEVVLATHDWWTYLLQSVDIPQAAWPMRRGFYLDAGRGLAE